MADPDSTAAEEVARPVLTATKDDHPYELPFYPEGLRQAGIAREPLGGVLFHYTDGDGALGILGESAIRATHVSFFDDTSEYEYGRALVEGPLRRLDEVGLSRVREAAERLFERRNGYDIYAACFCEHDDLLPQWKGYAADGAGYALGLPVKAISRNGAAALVPVRYGDESVTAGFNQMLDWGIDRIERVERRSKQQWLEEAGGIGTSLVSCLFLMLVAAKKVVFEHEREWRLIHLVDRDEPPEPEKIGFRSKGGILVPYVALELPKRPDGKPALSSIRCGPSLHPEVSRRGVQLLLEKLGIADVAIRVSDAPIRRK